MCEQLPQLQGGGWRVEVDDNFRFKPVEHVQWYAAVQEAGPDWFDLSLGVDVGGQRLDMLPVLIAALRARPELLSAHTPSGSGKGGSLYLRLDDGRLLPVPLERSLVPILHELLDAPAAGGSASRGWMPYGWDLERKPASKAGRGPARRASVSPPADSGGARTGRLARSFVRIRNRAMWLRFLRVGLGSILADDMGLGDGRRPSCWKQAGHLGPGGAGRADQACSQLASAEFCTGCAFTSRTV